MATTSRIIVKNLPKKLTEEELKNKFSEKGHLTDVQLKYTKDGKFRQFAFVGYSTEDEAKAAISYFDKSFFKSSRITVESCAQIGDESKPRAWSKHAPDSSAFKKLHAPKKPAKDDATQKTKTPKATNPMVQQLADKIEKYKNDPAFIEYMEVHSKDKSTWTEADISALLSIKGETESKSQNNEDSGVDEGTQSEEDETKKIAEDNTVSDAEYLKLKAGKITLDEVRANSKASADEKYFTLKIRGLPYKAKKKDVKEFFRPLKLDSIRVPQKIKGMAYVGFKDEKNMKKALLRNKSFIDGKRIFISELKTAESLNSDQPAQVTDKWAKQEEGMKNEEDVAESGRIFVRNLPYTSTEDELQKIFEKFGPVSEIIIPLDKLTRKIKGYGVVTFLFPEHAVKAYTELDGTVFHGRMLHLLPGKAKEVDDIEGVKEKSSYKTKKLKSLKAEAGSSYNWNTLFMGHNTVADMIASSYNTDKKEVLSGDNAAVRLALGETRFVQETKEFLESNGIKLDAFNRAVNHRSKNVILVKNLPNETRVEEIRELFSRYGVLGRVILPPHGITSIVEFVEPAEARTAFRRLAYSRFKHVPLYLEWAPDDTFQSVDVNAEGRANEAETDAQEEEGPADAEPEPETTLFIKNINFDTNEDAIRQHFKNCGRIASVTVARKKDPKKPGALLSMGYGFIQFYKESSANAALKTLQQSQLEGHCIELKRSNRTVKEASHQSRKSNNVEKQTGSKILVRNIPFQANLGELQELFKVFGHVKSIRLPKKMVGTGPHRGFAFVEYDSREDAKTAMQSLCQSTHLYGRRLVLEWAQTDEENITELRKRTAERFPKDKEVRSKKSRADFDIDKSDDDEMNEDDVNMFEE